MNSYTAEGETAVHLGARHGCWDVVDLLLRQDQDLATIRSSQGRTPVSMAVIGNTQKRRVKNIPFFMDMSSNPLPPTVAEILLKRVYLAVVSPNLGFFWVIKNLVFRLRTGGQGVDPPPIAGMSLKS